MNEEVKKQMHEDQKLKQIVVPEIKKGLKWYLGKIFVRDYIKK